MQKYGQHFLISESIIAQIIDASMILKRQNLVEIGPGKGALTLRLIERGQRDFTLVEIDPEMVAYLKEHLPKDAAITLVQGNFLEFDLSSLPQVPTEFVSNLPYIDAADILDKVLSFKHFETAVFMFQKEQAQRIRAKAGEDFYGPLSIFSQLRAWVNPICKVGKGCFNPPPKVESAVLSFEKKKQIPFCTKESWKNFRKVVLAAFAHKRKTAFNSLSLCGYEKEKIVVALEELHLPLTVRAEQIPAEKYVKLAEFL